MTANNNTILSNAETLKMLCSFYADAMQFLGVPKDNFTVEVPKGCVEKYRNARGWSEFKRISEYSNFACRPAQAQALNNVHQEDLVLNADGPWTVTDKPEWVTLSKQSGTGKTALSLTFQPLTRGTGNRTGVITHTCSPKVEISFIWSLACYSISCEFCSLYIIC